jgi:hypothetical protein
MGFGAGSSAVIPETVVAGAACARTTGVSLVRVIPVAAEVGVRVGAAAADGVARGDAVALGAAGSFFDALFFVEESLPDVSFEFESLPEPLPCEPEFAEPPELPELPPPEDESPPLEPPPDSEPAATGVVPPDDWSFLLAAIAGPAVTTARTSTANSAVTMRRTTGTPFSPRSLSRFGKNR